MISIKNMFRVWAFFRASILRESTICRPLPAGTSLTRGLLLSSGLL